MTPDVKIRDYYLIFLSNADKDIKAYNKEIEYYNGVKDKQLGIIESFRSKYTDIFNINIDNLTEAAKIANNLIRAEENTINTFYLRQIIKYDFAVNKINEYTNMITLANKRKSMKFREYETYVSNYYNKVHKFVLQGFGYKYGDGIGTLCICRWKRRGEKSKIDYNATNKRKKELLALGKKLYDKSEAAWYKQHNIPYDGIDFRVFKKDTHIYLIDIIKSKLFTNRNHVFEHTEYVNAKFKGMSYVEMADICDNIDDIVNLPVDLRYKLNIYLHKDPSNYILYIRNTDEDAYKHGAHNS